MTPEANPELYDSSCAGKDRYPSAGAALAVVIRARRGGKQKGALWDFGRHSDGLQPYLCPFGEIHPEGQWHLGHG